MKDYNHDHLLLDQYIAIIDACLYFLFPNVLAALIIDYLSVS